MIDKMLSSCDLSLFVQENQVRHAADTIGFRNIALFIEQQPCQWVKRDGYYN